MSATAVRSDWVGRVIDGRFPLREWLGGSSRSGVFLTGLPGDPAQKAAIKLIPSDTEAEDRLAGWAAAARLSHPHLVHVLYTGHCEIDGNLLIYAVTEYADEVLGEILSARALESEEVKELIGPVLEALSYIHERGFVHGRVKPSNMLAVGDVLKLSADSLVAAGSPPGYASELTIYDAPERDRGVLSPASDMWSLGVTLAEAITDRTPEWNRWSDAAPIIPDSIPEPFARVVRGCLDLDPERRFTLTHVRASLDPDAETPQVSAPAVSKEAAAPAETAASAPIAEPVAEPVFKTPHEPRHWSESRTPAKPQLRGILIAVVLIAVFLLLALHHKPRTSSSTKELQSPAASAPEEQQKPPAGIATPQQSATPHADSSSAPPPEAPPPESPGMGGPVIKGEVAQRVTPDVLAAASNSIHGTVKVRVRVNVGSAGDISSASFDSAGPSRYFARIAMETAQKWKFRPARVNGQPAASVWVLNFQFRRDGTEVTPAEVIP